MSKTFSQLRNELSKELFIEELDNESLFHIIESEEFVIEDKKNAMLELLEREIIDPTEEIVEFFSLFEKDIYDNPVNAKVEKSGQNTPLRSLSNRGFASNPKKEPVSTSVSSSQNKIKNYVNTVTNQTKPSSRGSFLSPDRSSVTKNKYSDTSGKSFYDLTKQKTPENVKSKQAGSADLFGGLVKIRRADTPQTKSTVASNKSPTTGGSGKPYQAPKQSSGSPNKPSSNLSPPTRISSSPSSKSSSVLKTQKDLISKGAKIKADGIMGPKTAAAQKQFGSKSTSPVAKPANPSAPVKKSLPTPTSKPSSAMNDLKKDVSYLVGATRGAAGATKNLVNKTSAIPGTGRMNKPIAPGGQSSSTIHSNIAKLGGEPVKSTPRAAPVKSLPSTTQGAPRASSSKPPPGGKWM